MNRARPGARLRDVNLQGDGGHPDVPIDLTAASDSGPGSPIAVQHNQRGVSAPESENDMFVPLDPPRRGEAQAPPPRRRVAFMGAVPPGPEDLPRPPRRRQSTPFSPRRPEAGAPFNQPPRQDRARIWGSRSPSLPSEGEDDFDADPPRYQDAPRQGGSRPRALDPQPTMHPTANGPPNPRNFLGDYIPDEDFDNAMIANLMGRFADERQVENGFGDFQQGAREPEVALDRRPAGPVLVVETKPECLQTVIALFPRICADYVSEAYDTVSTSSALLIAHILDRIENGSDYPRAKDKDNSLKRKREVDEDEEAALKYGDHDRIIPSMGGINTGVRGLIRSILSQEFASTPMTFIDAALGQSGHRLFSAYPVLEEAQRTYDPAAPPYRKNQKPRPTTAYRDEKLQLLMADPAIDRSSLEILEELIAARRIKGKADQKRSEARLAKLAEEENTRKAEAEGNMAECGCCMGDYPLNRMIHCDGPDLHWFCRGCALKTAETEIENGRYELKCMSMDGCSAGFSMEQRSHFLDAKTVVALERNEQESNLRLAGIENLASCPFCPYAAEYPPVEINREFECARPECAKISCRLCKKESHIPKSCEEHAKENGLSIRRQIEEAMSAALIRKCNKCQTPFIKEEGCNKMTCTRKGCHNIQCYVCSQSCGYDHFNDPTRGGKPGNCPLFESVERRHNREVAEAEKLAVEKVRADNPQYTVDDLKVKMSAAVKKDDDRRVANDPQARREAMRARHGAGPGQLPARAFLAEPFVPYFEIGGIWEANGLRPVGIDADVVFNPLNDQAPHPALGMEGPAGHAIAVPRPYRHGAYPVPHRDPQLPLAQAAIRRRGIQGAWMRNYHRNAREMEERHARDLARDPANEADPHARAREQAEFYEAEIARLHVVEQEERDVEDLNALDLADYADHKRVAREDAQLHEAVLLGNLEDILPQGIRARLGNFLPAERPVEEINARNAHYHADGHAHRAANDAGVPPNQPGRAGADDAEPDNGLPKRLWQRRPGGIVDPAQGQIQVQRVAPVFMNGIRHRPRDELGALAEYNRRLRLERDGRDMNMD